ncbi:galactose mutarotase [Metabacillus litoralis]|uniref:Aldose 1-epimerase n=1 Tax=Metabacillus litoralis TaxID=152268 RepID=A0A5C6WB53_9BACI|nr:aldose epimerase family protein [Metabacillus litoralis]TXC93119.1 galactose mutarotase [Metabacillus litoralis]
MKVVKERFGETNGETVYSYELQNDQGFKVNCISLGCIITSISTPDKNGNLENVVLGFDSVEEYLEHSPYFGSIVGRVAGRINNGKFELDGEPYSLPQNEKTNHLHGGPNAFDKRVWDAEIIEKENEIGVKFSLLSNDGENGYPGNVTVNATYLVNNQNELTITYTATTDKKTLINLTNHTYFNLSGNVKKDILSHKLKLKSDEYLELNELFIPTGEKVSVDKKPFDFVNKKELKEAILSNDDQIKKVGQGIDHPFILNENHNEEIVLEDETSGRKLIIETDEESVVVYTSNMLEGDFQIRGVQAKKYLGICLETQGLPDSINQPNFEPCILDVGEEYNTTTKYKFTTN